MIIRQLSGQRLTSYYPSYTFSGQYVSREEETEPLPGSWHKYGLLRLTTGPIEDPDLSDAEAFAKPARYVRHKSFHARSDEICLSIQSLVELC
jgi:hypothetical protein